MAVQLRNPDATHQWVLGDLLPGGAPFIDRFNFTRYYDGFRIKYQDLVKHYSSAFAVISMTPDYNVGDWSPRSQSGFYGLSDAEVAGYPQPAPDTTALLRKRRKPRRRRP